MAKVVIAEVRGASELNAALCSLGDKLVRRVLRKAVTKAAQPIIDEAKARAPILRKPEKNRRPGELRDSIIASVSVNQRRGTARARIGPKRSNGAGKQDPGCWGLMEEFGSKNNPPQPYLRPAYDGKGDESVRVLAEALRSGIAEVAGKG